MRNAYIDVLKGVAIIAVVLYHFGACKYGYLGVDIFLVIAGYFTASSIERTLSKQSGGGYISFIFSRLQRLLPLLLIAGAVSLLLGVFLMLPDDLENLCQSIVATNFFGNNILQCITTKNYWNVVNEYKPLMHTWYTGVVMQFYITIPLIYFSISKYIHGNIKRQIGLNAIIGALSLLMYLFIGTAAEKFYYLPFRLFEFCAGALVYHLLSAKNKPNDSRAIKAFISLSYLFLLLLVFANKGFINDTARLLCTVLSTALLLYTLPKCKLANNKLFYANNYIATIGMCSFSIYVWHQVVFAFTRYSFTSDFTDLKTISIMFGIVVILSFLSYKYVEKMKIDLHAKLWILTLFIFTSSISLYLYNRAGVVRDIPELEIMAKDAKRGMWAEYCDRGYKYDKDFSSNDKPHWFVIGNSFGRDWVNIIAESNISEKVEVSYTNDVELTESHSERFKTADIVFLSTLYVTEEHIDKVKESCSEDCEFYIVGEKNFGECNGQIYRMRFQDNYHEITTEMADGYIEKNNLLKAQYPKKFIDLIELVTNSEGKVKVFTDDGRFISQDCKHLTQAGAQYYAKLIDWSIFLPEECY